LGVANEFLNELFCRDFTQTKGIFVHECAGFFEFSVDGIKIIFAEIFEDVWINGLFDEK